MDKFNFKKMIGHGDVVLVFWNFSSIIIQINVK